MNIIKLKYILVTFLLLYIGNIGLNYITAVNLTPQQAVSQYYQWYLKCYANDEKFKNPCYFYKPSEQFVSKKLLAMLKSNEDIDYDYFLNVQDFDANIGLKTFKVVSTKKINNRYYIVGITMKGWDKYLNSSIDVILENNKWKINKVTPLQDTDLVN